MERAFAAVTVACVMIACGSDGTGPSVPQLDQQNLLDGNLGGQGIGRFDPSTGAPDPAGTSFDFQDAQTFTVGISGRLVEIKVPVINNQTPAATLGVTLEITRVAQGLPDESQSLGQVTLPAAAFPTDANVRSDPGAWATFDLRGLQITVTAGQELAFILRTASPIGYLYNPESTSGYPSGLGYRRNRAVTTGWTVHNDFGFQTFVESP